MLNFAVRVAREAGSILRDMSERDLTSRTKHGISNIVTDADTASERLIVQSIQKGFPDHSILAEESGLARGSSDFTWVVDPLDGTSNFAAGIPWYGVLLALLQQERVVLGVMFLPELELLYTASSEQEAARNGSSVRVSSAQSLDEVLWAYGMDGGSDDGSATPQLELLRKLLARVRNVRATNSLVDAAFTADGRLGGFINHSMKIWDIAASSLIISAAGGVVTDLAGRPLAFGVSADALEREYAVLAGAPALHASVLRIVSSPSLPQSI